MTISVNLWSGKTGEIKRFLERFYQKSVNMDDDVDQWVYIYNKPLQAIDIISAVIDNNDKYDLTIAIRVNDFDLHPVTYENHNDVIKGIYYLYYQETGAVVC